jgi:protoheme IX farnesyltransferase
MATEPTAAALRVTAELQGRHKTGSYAVLTDYWALTKPEVNFLIVLTTFAGFYLGYPTESHKFPLALLVHTLLGTLLIASGAGALNQFLERRFDAEMRRTSRRPLPAGRIEASAALSFGMILSFAGGIYLAAAVNALAGLLAVLTLLSYLFVYTPLKRETPLCTVVGAFPGAVPPLIGWAAASGGLGAEAWVLYAMLFLWQFPHFMAIAWMYRVDYARAGYLVLPREERRNSFMAWQSVIPSFVLVPLSLAPTLLGHAGMVYLVGAFVASSTFFCFGAQLALRKSHLAARRLLFASIIYIPSVLLLMVLDKR